MWDLLLYVDRNLSIGLIIMLVGKTWAQFLKCSIFLPYEFLVIIKMGVLFYLYEAF